MKLPNASGAAIDPVKVKEYLLSPVHPVGRHKAAFFRALGYTAAAWEVLSADLARHCLENEALESEASAYGQKYVVRGRLVGPSGTPAVVACVWILRTGEELPRLVTVVPG